LSLLLDTHVWVWWHVEPARLPARLRKAIAAAGGRGELYLSAISPWEVAMLVERKRLPIATDVLGWVEQALDLPGLSLYPLTPAVAVDASRLPGEFHQDPADRIIVATARELGATLLTKDERILAYPGVSSRWDR
jgi:PIN domain nuclease of toxin-antitoxin system